MLSFCIPWSPEFHNKLLVFWRPYACRGSMRCRHCVLAQLTTNVCICGMCKMRRVPLFGGPFRADHLSVSCGALSFI